MNDERARVESPRVGNSTLFSREGDIKQHKHFYQ